MKVYSPVIVVAPTIKPITTAEAKAQVRAADFTDDDPKIDALIAAATSYLDGPSGILGRALCEQTWRQDFGEVTSRCLRLPLRPVIEIVSVTYRDTGGDVQAVDPENYVLLSDELGSYVQLLCTFNFQRRSIGWPVASVTFKAGYANAGTEPYVTSTVPDAIKHAMLMLISHWYDNREAVVVGQRAQTVSVPLAVEALLASFRPMNV